MAKLQAATVSHIPVNRKRKRTSREAAAETPAQDHVAASEGVEVVTTTVPTKTRDGGPKPRRTKAGARPPALRRNSSTSVIESDIPWPEHFEYLAALHRALNLVYTFCCTRKHFATTWDNIKATVEGHIKTPLLVEDVAQVKALIPRAINFLYVDEEALLASVRGDDDVSAGNTDAFEKAAQAEFDRQKSKQQAEELLLFEFVDGDLKRQVIDPKTGQPTRATQKLRNEELKMPVFSQKSMLQLIEKRNLKFKSAVNGYMNDCAAANVDAVEKIKSDSEQYIPRPASSRSSTPAPGHQMPDKIPDHRKPISDIVKELTEQEWYTGQIVPDGHRVFDPQPPVYGELNFPLSQNLVNALYNVKGISQFYAHQTEAMNNLHDGNHVIVSTSTSSGKSLIYQVPMLHQLEQDPESRGMYIFPTKALAQDQKRSIKDLLSYLPHLENTMVETFDGDTPHDERQFIRDEARIIFTNPDMLHITILPQESTWRTFLKNLKYVVVDELHVYNGLLGAHVAFIMRRLRRICAAVGNRRVRFISCSATISNPEDHMRTIFGVDKVKLTDFDGSPSGRKEFVCWNTPYKDPDDPTSGRGDAFAETARLLCALIIRGVRVVCFCRVRKQCEVLLGAVKAEFIALERPDYISLVMGYRGGYSAADRRRIEAEMFAGKLRGIVATTALELGVDIGSLDAVVTMGFPYTIANLRQQSGRAGRRNQDSLSCLVGDCFPVDQHYMSNPDEIFTKPNCELSVDLTNELVVEGHIQCAAYEMPISLSGTDGEYLGKSLEEVARTRLIPDPDGLGFYHTHPRFRPLPSKHVNIRDTEDDTFAVIDTTHGRNVVLEEVEASRAFYTLYDGGIFLHQGRTYLVKDFSPANKMARVALVKVPYTTQQRDFTDVDPIETEQVRRINPDDPRNFSRAYFGRIKIHAVVFGFFKLDQKRRVLDAVAVDNPPIDIYSRGLWLDIPTRALEILKSKRLNVAAAIHAAEHAMMSLMPQFVVSMPGDVRTECKNALKEFAKKDTQRKRPARLTFYDAKGGPAGMGIAQKAFEFIDLLLERAVERVSACHCVEGCTECICDERCKEKNMIMSKAGAEVILRSLLNLEIDIDALPEGEEERVPAGIETVIGAVEVMGRDGRRVEESTVKRERSDEELIVIKDEDGEERALGLYDIPAL